jgi:hypothetical protein
VFLNALCITKEVTYDDLIYLLTAIGLTSGGSSTVHIYTSQKNTQNNTMTTEYTGQNIQDRIYITIRIHKHKDKNTLFTKLNRSIQNIQPYIQ